MGESTLTPPKLRGVYVNSSIVNERGSNKNKPSIGLRAISFQLHLTKVTRGLWDYFIVNLSSVGSSRTYESGQCNPNGWDYIHTTKFSFKPLHTPLFNIHLEPQYTDIVRTNSFGEHTSNKRAQVDPCNLVTHPHQPSIYIQVVCD